MRRRDGFALAGGAARLAAGGFHDPELLPVFVADGSSPLLDVAKSSALTTTSSTTPEIGCVCTDVPEEDCAALRDLARTLPEDGYPDVFKEWANCSRGDRRPSDPCQWAVVRSDRHGYVGCTRCDTFEEFFACEDLVPLQTGLSDVECLSACKRYELSCCQVSNIERNSCGGSNGARVAADDEQRAAFTCNESMNTERRVSAIKMRNAGASGLLPAALGKMKGLAELDVSYNKFNGAVPSEIASLPCITKLQLEHNNFNDIPEAFCSLFAKLDDGSCDLSNNKIKNPLSCAAGCGVSAGGTEAAIVLSILFSAALCVVLKPHRRWARRRRRQNASVQPPPEGALLNASSNSWTVGAHLGRGSGSFSEDPADDAPMRSGSAGCPAAPELGVAPEADGRPAPGRQSKEQRFRIHSATEEPGLAPEANGWPAPGRQSMEQRFRIHSAPEDLAGTHEQCASAESQHFESVA